MRVGAEQRHEQQVLPGGDGRQLGGALGAAGAPVRRRRDPLLEASSYTSDLTKIRGSVCLYVAYGLPDQPMDWSEMQHRCLIWKHHRGSKFFGGYF